VNVADSLYAEDLFENVAFRLIVLVFIERVIG
jgi:hypothetical protein